MPVASRQLLAQGPAIASPAVQAVRHWLVEEAQATRLQFGLDEQA